MEYTPTTEYFLSRMEAKLARRKKHPKLKLDNVKYRGKLKASDPLRYEVY